jgi:hypothetical protein
VLSPQAIRHVSQGDGGVCLHNLNRPVKLPSMQLQEERAGPSRAGVGKVPAEHELQIEGSSALE